MPWRWRTGWIGSAAWMALLAAVAAGLQLYTSVPFDSDTSYHVAVARLIRQHGILHAFPWTPFSWLADHYADKELLFHLLLVPVSGLDWVTAAKIVGAVATTLLLWTLYGVLRAERVPWGGAWTLLPLLASGYVIQRLALVRPHVLAVALALAVTWAAARRRLWVLALACLLYPWSYTAWHTALVLVAVVELAFLLSGRRPDWRPAAAAAGGLALGLLSHPNFPDLLRFFWIVNYQALVSTAWGNQAGFTQGTEFLPFDRYQLAYYGIAVFAFAAAALPLAFRRRRADPVPLAFALAAAAFAVLTAASQRFIEYLGPFSAAALALAVRDGWRPRAVAAAVCGASAAYTLAFGTYCVELMRKRTDDFPPEVAREMQARVPPGAQVFTCNWISTGKAMLALPERRLMVALDPVLFHVKDPRLYALWYDLVRTPPPSPAFVVREAFGASFVLCEKERRFYRFNAAMRQEPGVELEMDLPRWTLLRLGR